MPHLDADDDLRDNELPDESDNAGDEEADEDATITCPVCSAEVYADSEVCAVCGNWIERRPASAWEGRHWWWVLLAVAGMVAVIVVLTLRG